MADDGVQDLDRLVQFAQRCSLVLTAMVMRHGGSLTVTKEEMAPYFHKGFQLEFFESDELVTVVVPKVES